MTFKDVVIKNFLKNLRKYLSYYLSGTFCVTIFFIYSTMIFLDSVMDSCDEYPMRVLFVVTAIIIGLFSIFFISYAHQAFVKNKKKELGVYLVVGFSEHAARKMLLIEACIVAIASLVSGIVIGTLFSRYFQLIVMKLVGIQEMDYQLSYINFLLTCVMFAFIYGGCFLYSDQSLKNEDITSLMKEHRRRECRPYRKADSYLTVLGLISLIFSAVFIGNVADNNHINSKLWVLFLFLISGYVGLYLLINSGGKTLVQLCKNSTNYYKKMMVVSEIEHKLRQNTKVILILSMLASLIVLLVGSPFALINISADIAEESCKDLQYATLNDYDASTVSELLSEKKDFSIETSEVAYVFDNLGVLKPVMMVEDYNRKMNTELSVKPGEIYHMIITWKPGELGISAGEEYTITCGETHFTYVVCESVKGTWDYLSLFPTESILLLSEKDYNEVCQDLNIITVNTVTFKNGWKDTKNLVASIKKELGENSYVCSRIETYQELKNGYSVFLFVTCSMCFMFFVATGSVMYFKQYNDIDEDKEQYRRLFHLGITDKEIKRNVSYKLSIVFFTPLLGSIMGLLIMYYLSNLFGGNNIVNTFMKKGSMGIVFYASSQMIFYLVLRCNYIRDLLYHTELQ